MPWSEWLESEEEEVTNDVLVVVMQPGNSRGYISQYVGSDSRLTCQHKPQHC